MAELLTQAPARDLPLREASAELERRLRAGETRVAEAVLAAYPELAADADSALQLIYDELVLRERLGEQPAYEEYYARFPQWQAELRKSFDIHETLVRRGPTAAAAPVPSGWHRYELLDEIGRGGMGVVYRARQPGLNRIVALKMILAGELADADDQARFRTEAEATARLQHPNIVQVYEVGEQDGRPFLALEYVDGGSLDKKLNGTPLPPRDAVQLVETLARAVHYAHEHGVLHRDLKPANVLLQTTEDTEDTEEDRRARPPLFSVCSVSSVVSLLPKVADFGLAKRLAGTAGASTAGGPTETGEVLGTPSYMAPEQAEGKLRAVGPATDVYALGAILYEALTGRPPFKGETALETLVQVKEQAPVSPRRLYPKVPRDLETICLKCLEKEPAQRYARAAALAEDLCRFREGRPIVARPTGRLEQAWRWGKRNPREATITALVLTLLVLGLGGAWWLERQQGREAARTNQARERVETALKQEAASRRDFHWPQAEDSLEEAAKDARQAGLHDLLARVHQARYDLNMARLLDQIRLTKWRIVEGKMTLAAAGPTYAKAFEGYGLDVQGGDVAELADQVRASAVREELVAALDDWILDVRDEQIQERLLAVVRQADRDQWRNAVRDQAVWRDRKKLEELAQNTETESLTPAQSILLAKRLLAGGADGVALLRRAQQRHPHDFWLSFELAGLLWRQGKVFREEAVGYFRVALAVRPESFVAHSNLGNALRAQGNLKGALAAYRRALELDGNYSGAYIGLGRALLDTRDMDGAITALQRALELDPHNALAHHNMGVALRAKEDLDGALAAFQQSIALDGQYALAHYNLGIVLQAKRDLGGALAAFRRACELDPEDGLSHYKLANLTLEAKRDVEGALAAYRRTIAIDPHFADAHNGLGNALQAKRDVDGALAAFRRACELDAKRAGFHYNLGNALRAKRDWDGALAAYHRALELDRNFTNAHIGLGNALLAKDDVDAAIAAYRRACELAPKLALARNNLGSALLTKGDLDGAVAAYQEAIRLQGGYAEAHCGLGHALRDSGKFAQALTALRRGHELGSKNPQWPHDSARWVRDCERLVNLDGRWPAVLEDASVESAEELLALAEVCRLSRKHHAAAARCYAAAFRADPKLAADHCFKAARAAALAAGGQGADAAGLDDAERARLRRQALDWLRAQRERVARLLEQDAMKHGPVLQRSLAEWQRTPDLAGVRDEGELARLPEEQQQEWRQLWEDVARLLRSAGAPEPKKESKPGSGVKHDEDTR